MSGRGAAVPTDDAVTASASAADSCAADAAEITPPTASAATDKSNATLVFVTKAHLTRWVLEPRMLLAGGGRVNGYQISSRSSRNPARREYADRSAGAWSRSTEPSGQGRTREEALANIREAIGGYLASMREQGAPLPASSEFQVLEVPA